MNEDFAPFELAVKLREKGFNYPCIGHYVNNQLYIAHYQNAFHSDNDKSIDTPTISQVLKWLREEKKIHIAVDIMKAYPAGNIIKWGYDVVLIDKYEVYHHDWNSDSYEQAALAGIEYVLDNLI